MSRSLRPFSICNFPSSPFLIRSGHDFHLFLSLTRFSSHFLLKTWGLIKPSLCSTTPTSQPPLLHFNYRPCASRRLCPAPGFNQGVGSPKIISRAALYATTLYVACLAYSACSISYAQTRMLSMHFDPQLVSRQISRFVDRE